MPIEISVPGWVIVEAQRFSESGFKLPEERMGLVIRLSELNSIEGGGPFAAAVFDSTSHELVAAGVNCVLSSGYSMAHAEVVALSLAQKAVGKFDLGSEKYELVTSTEPCAMCLGAICWSGIRQVVCGARESDAQAVGFDEGPKPADWVAELEKREISVQRDVLREQAAQVLLRYLNSGGKIYNARGSSFAARCR